MVHWDNKLNVAPTLDNFHFFLTLHEALHKTSLEAMAILTQIFHITWIWGYVTSWFFEEHVAKATPENLSKIGPLYTELTIFVKGAPIFGLL